MTDAAADSHDRNEPEDRPEKDGPRPLSYARPGSKARGGALRIYKPGQGYYTRMCTGIAGAVLALWAGASLYDQLSSFMDTNARYRYPVSYGVTVAVILALGAGLYWLLFLSRRPNEFFIHTEGEMKKVSWSSRKEVVRSTKVVITAVVLLGALLFLADLFFMWFFGVIGVLKAFSGVGIGALFGSGSDAP